MQKQFEKVDANTLKITEQVVVKPAVSTYKYEDLVSIRDSLLVQKDAFNRDIDAKIAEAEEHIAAADNLGLVETAVTRLEEMKAAEVLEAAKEAATK